MEPLAWYTFDLPYSASKGFRYLTTASSFRTAFMYIAWAIFKLTLCCMSRQEVEPGATDNPRLASKGANKRTGKVKKNTGRQ